MAVVELNSADMASAHMPRGFNPRGTGRMDSERENFEKTQVLNNNGSIVVVLRDLQFLDLIHYVLSPSYLVDQ